MADRSHRDGGAHLEVPPIAKELGERFRLAGYDLVIVGGAVRDLLLERERPHDQMDLDFATDALPEHLRQYAAQGRATAYLRAAEYLYEGLETRAARRRLLQATRMNPRRAPAVAGLLVRTFLPRRVIERLRVRRRPVAP